MEKLIIINPFCPENKKKERLNKIVEYSIKDYETCEITTAEELENADLTYKRILFVVSLGESGINMNLYGMMKVIRLHRKMFEGSVGGVILDSNSEMYTKSTGRSIVFTANMSGCTFPGKPLVEGTSSLKNYNVQAKNLNVDNINAYMEAGKTLVENIMNYKNIYKKNPNLLVMYSGNKNTSNSMNLWGIVSKNLPEFNIRELSMRNGHITDCRGCSYETCRHFGEEGSCFYGGPIVEEVYPAILEADAIVMVCPNYNDALGANLTAFVNRLTALFTIHRFYDKKLFGVIVSGYSGGDIVAEQLISGLNMNKTFALPGKFAILETANNPMEILDSEGIEERGRQFACTIKNNLMGKEVNEND